MVTTVPNAGSMSGGQMLSFSGRLVRQSWQVMAFLILIGTCVSWFSYSLQTGSLQTDSLQIGTATDLSRVIWLTLASSAVGLFLNTLITLVALDRMLDQPRSAVAIFILALRKLPVLLIQLILFAFVVVLGFGFLLVPGMILMITLLPASTLLTIRGYDPVSTLAQSHKLVWGNWWRVANVYSLYSLVALLVLLPVGGVVASLFDGTIMETISLTSALVTPVVTAGLAVLNLVLCQELLMRQKDQTLVDYMQAG